MAKRKYKKRKKSNDTLNIKIVGVIVFSILLAILLYANSGALGEKLNMIFGGMIGWLKYILPIGMFAIAIKTAYDENEDELLHKILQYIVLLMFVAIALSVYQISQGKIEIKGDIY